MKYGNKFMYLIESAWKKNTTYLTWTVFIYVIKNKHSIILYERNEFCIVKIKYGNNLCIWLKVPARKTQLRKTNVFKKDWNFASCSCFATCIIKKDIFIMGERNCIFLTYFHNGIIFYIAELFECAFNFRFC